ncbi:hypothetical protein N8751_01620 [bacterium]|nr:hypothetical protein [bacterium]
MFAQRIISGQAGPVTFDSLDRAARLTKAVEDSRNFFSWVDSNEKEPKYFSDWENLSLGLETMPHKPIKDLLLKK